MFGVTTPCVQALTAELEADYDCLVFHATGIGGRSMENLADSGMLAGRGRRDDDGGGGPPGRRRLPGDRGPLRLPSSASRSPMSARCGALDMVNFGPRDTVPEKFRGRNFVVHNPNVTLMRTTRDENVRVRRLDRRAAEPHARAGAVPASRKAACRCSTRPGKPFHDPEADNALFETIEKNVVRTGQRQVIRVPAAINEQPFVAALVNAFRSIAAPLRKEGLEDVGSLGARRLGTKAARLGREVDE